MMGRNGKKKKWNLITNWEFLSLSQLVGFCCFLFKSISLQDKHLLFEHFHPGDWVEFFFLPSNLCITVFFWILSTEIFSINDFMSTNILLCVEQNWNNDNNFLSFCYNNSSFNNMQFDQFSQWFFNIQVTQVKMKPGPKSRLVGRFKILTVFYILNS